MTTKNECQHGQLKRQCPLCERDEEIARLRKTLEFYADPDSYDQLKYALSTEVERDNGDRARLALGRFKTN